MFVVEVDYFHSIRFHIQFRYYTKDDMSFQKGAVQITKHTIATLDPSKEHCFTVSDYTSELMLTASSDSDRIEWISKVTNAVNRVKEESK